jgi:predicted nucleotidyltransferase
MKYNIETIRKKIVPIAKAHGVKRMGLFGSYARGEANENSDIDIIIEGGKITSLFKYCAFVNDLEDELKCHVDVVTSGIRDKVFWDNIKRDEVLLYEEQ